MSLRALGVTSEASSGGPGVKMGAWWSRGQQSERRRGGLLEPRLCPSGSGVGDEQSQVQDGAAAASRQGQCLLTARKDREPRPGIFSLFSCTPCPQASLNRTLVTQRWRLLFNCDPVMFKPPVLSVVLPPPPLSLAGP